MSLGEDLVLLVWGRGYNLAGKQIIGVKSKGMKTMSNLAESSKEGCGSKRTVLDVENRIDLSDDATPICQYQRFMYWVQSDVDRDVVMTFFDRFSFAYYII
jgi:hypothetical protein